MAVATVGCSDGDRTMICVGPGCPDYDGPAPGVGGGGNGGSGGGGEAGGGSGGAEVDAGVDGSTDPEPVPEGGVPEGGSSDPCEVEFVGPLGADGGALVLGPDDDLSGDACGAEFSARFSIATNASSVNVFVNENAAGPQAVTSETTDVDVLLGNRGATPNSVRVVAEMADGRECEAAFPSDILVDCDGPSCSIPSPTPAVSNFLNASQDGDPSTAGLQTSVTVQSEGEHVGQTVRLEIDEVFLQDGEVLVADGDDAVGTFAALTFAEGEHVVRAECRDALGNVTLSSPATWVVDITPCSIAVDDVAGGADPITRLNDSDAVAADIQVAVEGTISGTACDAVRVGVCAQPPSNTLDATAGAFSIPITLAAATASFSVCADVVDEAGNASDQVSENVNVRASDPVVDITAPANNATFNLASGCDTTVVVTCSDNGEDVDLLVDGNIVDTALCAGGTASFDLEVPTNNDGSTTTIAVEHNVDGLESAPESITVQADCTAPTLSFSAPACGGELALAGDDVAPGTAGLQFDVVVNNSGNATVDLTITRGATDTELTETGNATTTTFTAADLGGAGLVELEACATDAQGNEGCTDACLVTIEEEPSIAITSPTDGATLNAATTDCDAVTSGLQITVTGTTSAPDESVVEVGLGAGATQIAEVAAGAWSACIQALDGDDQTLSALVVDEQTELSGTASITVSVDVTPSGVIAAPGFAIANRRGGLVNLSWQSVLDSDGDPLAAYRLRCATTDITNEATWATATDIPVSVTPSAVAGASEGFQLTNFKTGTTRFCVVRGEDEGGNLSPFTGDLSTQVTNAFLSQQYTVVDDPNAAAAVARISVEPLGDINGDGIADFAYGATNRVAQIFFGQSLSGTGSETADVTIQHTAATNAIGFGSEVSGLGDINGDTIPDFAIGAPGGNAVFVFFGRATNTWPATITVDSAGACEADLCIFGSALGGTSGGLFGWEVHSANFDSAGPNDIVIAARTANTRGQVFILLGGTQLATPNTNITIQNATPATNTVVGFIVNGPAANPNFGFSVGSVGATLNNVVIGANGVGTGGTAGAVFFLPSQSTPTPGSGLTALTTPTLVEVDSGTQANFGSAVRAVGDYDLDGFQDFAAGEAFDVRGLGTLYRGSVSGFSSGTLQLSFTNDLSPTVDDNYATFVATGMRPDLGLVGDLDKDGSGDVVIGATSPDSPAGAEGSAQLFYGAAGAVGRGRTVADMTYTSTLEGGQVVPNFVGDIDGDTFNDLVMLDSGAGANVLFVLY